VPLRTLVTDDQLTSALGALSEFVRTQQYDRLGSIEHFLELIEASTASADGLLGEMLVALNAILFQLSPETLISYAALMLAAVGAANASLVAVAASTGVTATNTGSTVTTLETTNALLTVGNSELSAIFTVSTQVRDAVRSIDGKTDLVISYLSDIKTTVASNGAKLSSLLASSERVETAVGVSNGYLAAIDASLATIAGSIVPQTALLTAIRDASVSTAARLLDDSPPGTPLGGLSVGKYAYLLSDFFTYLTRDAWERYPKPTDAYVLRTRNL
jgi:ABC-type transporter Mla subunit MlaD